MIIQQPDILKLQPPIFQLETDIGRLGSKTKFSSMLRDIEYVNNTKPTQDHKSCLFIQLPLNRIYYISLQSNCNRLYYQTTTHSKS